MAKLVFRLYNFQITQTNTSHLNFMLPPLSEGGG